MSFVQKNKAWLLPILGAGVVWAFWNMYQAFTPVPAAPVQPASAPLAGVPPAPVAPAPSPTPLPAPLPPPPPPQPSAPPAANAGLWADLTALEASPAELNRTEELLKEGEKPLTPAGMQELPEPQLSPEEWRGLPEPQILRVAPRGESMTPAAPLPRLDFVLERDDTKVKEAWMGGRGYREGASPNGTHRIKRITDNTVLLAGPTGEILLTTDLGTAPPPPKAETPTASAEAK